MTMHWASGEVNLNYELTTLTQEDIDRIFNTAIVRPDFSSEPDLLAESEDARAGGNSRTTPCYGGYLYCFRDDPTNDDINWFDAASWPEPLPTESLEVMRDPEDILNHD